MHTSTKSQYLREKKIQVFACFIGPQESAKVNSVFTEWKKNIELFNNKRSYIITINVKKNNSFKFSILYEKFFSDKNRNIIIYSNF